MGYALKFLHLTAYVRWFRWLGRTTFICSAFLVAFFQWHCCGVLGPQDYMISSWFNSTPDTEAIFVPQSCCVGSHGDGTGAEHGVAEKHWRHQQPTQRHSRRHQRRVMNSRATRQENYCQIDAIMFPKTVNRSEYLHTRVPFIHRYLYM